MIITQSKATVENLVKYLGTKLPSTPEQLSHHPNLNMW